MIDLLLPYGILIKNIVATINKVIILPLFSICWVFLCFRNPPNSDMEWWTAGSLTCVHDHSYACVYTRGLGTLTVTEWVTQWAQHFWLGFCCCCCSWRGLNHGSSNLEWCFSNWATGFSMECDVLSEKKATWGSLFWWCWCGWPS